MSDIIDSIMLNGTRYTLIGSGGGGSGVTEDVKTALLQLADKVTYEHTTDGGECYQDLYDALYPPVSATDIALDESSISFSLLNTTKTLTATVTPADSTDEIEWESSDPSVATVNAGVVTSVAVGSATITATAGNVSASCSVLVASKTVSSISAAYTQSGTVYNCDSLASLKPDLIVTVTWQDSTTSTVPSTEYALSGTLATGTNTITASYGGKTDTFSVTVTASKYEYFWDFTESLTDKIGGSALAALTNCTRTSGGVVFNAAASTSSSDPVGNQYVELGNVFGIGKTLEIRIKDAEAKFGNENGIICEFWDGETDPGVYNAFGWRYNSSSAKRKWGNITKDNAGWKYWSTNDATDKTALNGNHTVEYVINSSGYVYEKVDGARKNATISDYYTVKYTDANQAKYAIIGSKLYYPNYYNMTVTHVGVF